MKEFVTVEIIVEWDTERDAHPSKWNWEGMVEGKAAVLSTHPTTDDQIKETKLLENREI